MLEIIKKPVKIATPHIDAIHGHTILEFRDVRNGKRERIESDNLVTQGAEELMRTYGIFALNRFVNTSNSFSAYNTPLYRVLFGGILLFDTPIDETKLFPVGGNTMVANGCYGEQSDSSTTTFGAFNSSESSASMDTVTMVYDWSTDRGNGDIASVCLTSGVGGYIGYGNLPSTAMHGYMNANSGASMSIVGERRSDTFYSVKLYNNFAYMLLTPRSTPPVSGSATSVTLYKHGCPVDTISSLTPMSSGGFSYSDGEQVTINFTVTGYNMYCVGGTQTKFILMGVEGNPSNQWATGKIAKFLVIDITDETATEYTVTNNSGVNFRFETDLDVLFTTLDSQFPEIILQKYTSSTYDAVVPLYKVNLSTGVITDMEVSSYCFEKCVFSENLMISTGRPNNTTNPYAITDLVNKTMKRINTGSINGSSSRNWARLGVHDKTAFLFETATNGSWNQFMMLHNPLALTTINNLDSPVTKTANLTMKVTYTLTME